MTIYCLSCVSRKQAGTHPARDLYISDWFRNAHRYVEARLQPGDQVFILSARYGAIEWTREIEAYDERLKDKTGEAFRHWHRRVAEELFRNLPDATPDTIAAGVNIVILAGERYRRLWPTLLPRWTNIPLRISVPLEGLGIGQQLAALKGQCHP
jgi:hypothetical protein